jgi:transcriptional regulator with XRE-family HTH domain
MSGNHMTARAFVAGEIRRAREMKTPKMSQARLADEIFVSESLVAAWERGRLVPGEQHHARLREVLDLPDMIVRIIEKLVTNEVSPEWFGKWPQVERQATSLWSFEPCLVPGLLQTSDYARAVLEAASLDIDLDEALAMRIERQQVLTKEDPPLFVALIAESVVRHRVGSGKVMHDQLMHLAEMAERANVIVQVIPDSSVACAGFIGGFVIASFDGEEVGYVDNQLAGDTIESTDRVTRLRRFFDVFRGDTLNQQDSIDLIRRAAEEWK